MLAQQIDGRQGFERWDISSTGHHHIRFAGLVVRSPLPDSDSNRAMLDGGLHVQPLQCRLLSRNDYVDVVSAVQAMIRHRKKSVGIRRKVHADVVRFFVYDVIDEARILVSEAVMVLAPNVRSKE